MPRASPASTLGNNSGKRQSAARFYGNELKPLSPTRLFSAIKGENGIMSAVDVMLMHFAV
jgi:hypothetical protein